MDYRNAFNRHSVSTISTSSCRIAKCLFLWSVSNKQYCVLVVDTINTIALLHRQGGEECSRTKERYIYVGLHQLTCTKCHGSIMLVIHQPYWNVPKCDKSFEKCKLYINKTEKNMLGVMILHEMLASHIGGYNNNFFFRCKQALPNSWWIKGNYLYSVGIELNFWLFMRHKPQTMH